MEKRCRKSCSWKTQLSIIWFAQCLTWYPFHWQFFHHNSIVVEISFCSHPNSNEVITTKFCTCHDSCAVMACAKFCCDMYNSKWITAKRNFHQIWIVMANSLVTWVTGPSWDWDVVCQTDLTLVMLNFFSQQKLKYIFYMISQNSDGTCISNPSSGRR